MTAPRLLRESVKLANSMYAQGSLTEAQMYMTKIIKYSLPSWLASPKGQLAEDWNAPTPLAAQHLIYLCESLHALSEKTNRTSPGVFRQKVKALLKQRSTKQLNELLNEIHIGKLLSGLDSTLHWEPLSRAGSSQQSSRSPDYLLKFATSEVFVEATTLHLGHLDRDRKNAKDLRDRTMRGNQVSAERRIYRLDAGRETSSGSVSKRDIREALDRSAKEEIGAHHFPELSNASLYWKPMPITEGISNDAEAFALIEQMRNEGVDAAAFGNGVCTGSTGFFTDLEIAGNTKLHLDSIENSLSRKRQQFVRKAPSVIALKLSGELEPSGFLDWIEEVLWRKPRYSWLTGILVYQPRTEFKLSSPLATLTASWNPQARHRCPEELAAHFEPPGSS